jgi:predicted nucleic acid-binding protein
MAYGAYGLLRIVANQRIFDPPSTTEQAFRFLDALIERPICRLIRPGPRHWRIFPQLCEDGKLRGKIVADAAHAALASESGREWVTAGHRFCAFRAALAVAAFVVAYAGRLFLLTESLTEEIAVVPDGSGFVLRNGVAK